ncbi:MAG: zinc-ribbon domain-containing protein [Oscillospiraceae bacterium]|nr:zinc-ribbon domain-containing protein [Oscillospiraceae bacterium]
MEQFMYGRYGQDEFSRFLMIAALVLFVLALIFNGYAGTIFYAVAVVALVYDLIRIMSRNLYKRQQENEWYLKKRKAVTGWFRSLKDRWQQRKEYRFYRCPSCHTLLRVPRGKGKILVTCRKCGRRFERKT